MLKLREESPLCNVCYYAILFFSLIILTPYFPL